MACKAQEMSTRTGGYILLQLLFDLAKPGAQVDRLLNGPTNEVWFNPWLDYLRKHGLYFFIYYRIIFGIIVIALAAIFPFSGK